MRLWLMIGYIVAINIIIHLFAWLLDESFDHAAVCVIIGVLASLAAGDTVRSVQDKDL